ncbi:hypothetical protein N566_26395 [Streptomycetaceae bacterium MP113-05]|nr:hypothetical protein N566_26395 [Streptomycetaceae bacterium MP113-05]
MEQVVQKVADPVLGAGCGHGEEVVRDAGHDGHGPARGLVQQFTDPVIHDRDATSGGRHRA